MGKNVPVLLGFETAASTTTTTTTTLTLFLQFLTQAPILPLLMQIPSSLASLTTIFFLYEENIAHIGL